jgi:hypothetical protein
MEKSKRRKVRLGHPKSGRGRRTTTRTRTTGTCAEHVRHSCLATITLSLRDKSHSLIEGLKLAPMGWDKRLVDGANLKVPFATQDVYAHPVRVAHQLEIHRSPAQAKILNPDLADGFRQSGVC